MGLKHDTKKSFSFAMSGMRQAIATEPNLRIHFGFAAAAIILALILGLTAIEWVIILSVIFYVISLELLNTVIEALVNMVSPQIRKEAKIAKDVSAAVVFCAAVLSVFVGIFLFLPKIIALVR